MQQARQLFSGLFSQHICPGNVHLLVTAKRKGIASTREGCITILCIALTPLYRPHSLVSPSLPCIALTLFCLTLANQWPATKALFKGSHS